MRIANVFSIPHFIKAGSPQGLRLAMLKNNLNMKAECQYFDIQFDGSNWYAWYYREATEKPSLVIKKGSLDGAES
jgi:hypothetical protein